MAFDLFAEVVREGSFVLITENVENFRVLAGFYIAITAVGLEVEAYIFARRSVLHGELLFDLPQYRSR
jgi:hypothetical protein